jgi:hypothetical protein
MADAFLDEGYYVYKFTNKVNSKIYIGYTSQTLKERRKNHKQTPNMAKTRNTHWGRAIAKYGIDGFVMNLISEHSTADEAKEAEVHWILKEKSYLSHIGYNSKVEKDGGREFLSEEEKQKISFSARKNKKGGTHGVCVFLNKTSEKFTSSITWKNEIYQKYFDNLEDAKIASDMFLYYVYGLGIKYNYEDRLSLYSEDSLYFNFCGFKMLKKSADESKFFGVAKRINNWQALVNLDGRVKSLGFYGTEEEAAIAADKARFSFRGENSRFYNFPEKIKDYNKEECKEFLEKSIKPKIFLQWREEDYRYCVFIKKKQYGSRKTLEEGIILNDMACVKEGLIENIYYKDRIKFYQENYLDYFKKYEKKAKNFIGTFQKGKYYQATICHNNKIQKIGMYLTEEDAAKAYDFTVCSMSLQKCKKLNFEEGFVTEMPKDIHSHPSRAKYLWVEKNKKYFSSKEISIDTGLRLESVKYIIGYKKPKPGYTFVKINQSF